MTIDFVPFLHPYRPLKVWLERLLVSELLFSM